MSSGNKIAFEFANFRSVNEAKILSLNCAQCLNADRFSRVVNPIIRKVHETEPGITYSVRLKALIPSQARIDFNLVLERSRI